MKHIPTKRKLAHGALVMAMILSICFQYCMSRHLRNQENCCLKIHGVILTDNGPVGKNVHVRLLDGNKPVDSILIGTDGYYEFTLKKNKEYIIRAGNSGCQAKEVCVCTRLPENCVPDTSKPFCMDLIRVSEKKCEAMPAHDLGLPEALVCYDTTGACFRYDSKYSAFIQKQHSNKLAQL